MLCCRFIWASGGSTGYEALLLKLSSTTAKPKPVRGCSIADCCFVGRGDDGGDDDNDDNALLVLTVACSVVNSSSIQHGIGQTTPSDEVKLWLLFVSTNFAAIDADGNIMAT